MATQTVTFSATHGQTVTAKLFPRGSDTQTASVSATAATNRTGVYTAAFTDVAAGVYQLIAVNGAGTKLAEWWLKLAAATGGYQAYETPDIADLLGYLMAAEIGACADAGTSAETYAITVDGSTYTIDHTGLDATGNRGTATLTKS